PSRMTRRKSCSGSGRSRSRTSGSSPIPQRFPRTPERSEWSRRLLGAGSTAQKHAEPIPPPGEAATTKVADSVIVSAVPLPFRPQGGDDLSPDKVFRRYRTLIEQLPLVVYL